MICQHCQTWILDDDHRCSRCGRRVRTTPSRISPKTYPIAATATAPAYDFDPDSEEEEAAASEPEQRTLFANIEFNPRVIPFDSLTTPAERESIRARAADLARPAPLESAKVEMRRARPRKRRSADQRRLEFLGEEEFLAPPESSIICDAPVAPSILRVEATLIDAALILLGCLIGGAIFAFEGGEFVFDKHVLPFLALALITVPLIYKLLWAFVGCDTIGMTCVGLCLVDFDGNPPSQERRYHRLLGSFISLFAAGIGLVWALVDEDGLTWHDHISSTFPTIALEN